MPQHRPVAAFGSPLVTDLKLMLSSDYAVHAFWYTIKNYFHTWIWYVISYGDAVRNDVWVWKSLNLQTIISRTDYFFLPETQETFIEFQMNRYCIKNQEAKKFVQLDKTCIRNYASTHPVVDRLRPGSELSFCLFPMEQLRTN